MHAAWLMRCAQLRQSAAELERLQQQTSTKSVTLDETRSAKLNQQEVVSSPVLP